MDRAKAYELTHRDQNAVSAYVNKFAPAGSSTQTENLYKAIQELTKQVQQLGTNRNYRSNNYNNNNKIYNNIYNYKLKITNYKLQITIHLQLQIH